ncbi:hypothetical protein GYN07_16410 [Rhizobium leguminosarum bv. viciae 248]|uniref:hypothetical protein n=1 Tax=Rhizobium leguminosarum TaxID=384 RepID=UPI00037BCDFD|nr:hypothetical protein [Rhizobium leguminosarum]QHW25827.1 hypothetical protein GYN07_16410 [Rhizobium leguminosarum bv. viciae 248]
MRVFSLRSSILSSLAALVCLIFIHVPTYAAWPVAPGIEAVETCNVLMKHIVPVQSVRTIVAERRQLDRQPIASARAERLKPAYRESYETHGLTFLKHRLLC